MDVNNQIKKRASTVIIEIAQETPETGLLTYQHVLEKLGDRAFGMALIFFALPSAMPFSVIPGISFIFSVPIAIFAVQIFCLRKIVWLPAFLKKRTVSQKTIYQVVSKSKRYLVKTESFLRPRLYFMSTRLMHVINGLFILLLSVLLMLPIPLSNFIFAGLIMLFGFGMIERDGVFILAGYIGSFIYFAVMYFVIVGVIRAMTGL